ncbi:MAG: hypothetical protein LCH41_01715 [Armatimonadetes bacterium]|nr:hypothetical protein [Armatimonadota bacterium]
MITNATLGVAFLVLGFAATVLQLWLWTFPMVPDPGGPDPHGKTSAPPFWRMVHRVLGYGFVLIYLALMARMIPRIPFLEGETADTATWIHLALGWIIGILLVGKVVILRFAQEWGNRLRAVGVILFLATLVMLGTIARPAQTFASLPATTVAERQTKALISENCGTCHGAMPLFHGDDSWSHVLEEMQEIAQKSSRPDPLGSRGSEMAAYLQKVLPRSERREERHRERESEREDD